MDQTIAVLNAKQKALQALRKLFHKYIEEKEFEKALYVKKQYIEPLEIEIFKSMNKDLET